MDAYPPEYVALHLPVLGVFGLPMDIPDHDTDASVQLAIAFKKQLLTALAPGNLAGVWDAPVRATTLFSVVPFHKSYTLPPKKAPPSRNAPVAHSPLSPLTATSPLHPDGLISPLWINRHRELLPSVILGFYDLWEPPSTQLAPDRNRDPLGAQHAASLERERDSALCQEINDKRKPAQERGIKFSVVILLGSLTRLEDPHTEERLSYIRKSCTLDSKHSLFALPFGGGMSFDPNDFATSLQRALYDSASNFYREHGKRVKRKKLRYATTGPVRNIPPPPTASALTASSATAASQSSLATPAKPLSSHGWSIRYDFKAAVFSEFRQDYEAAVKSYESAYQTLLEMFLNAISAGVWAPGGGSHAADGLLPYTNRWIEARTLLDCISIKISRLLLHSDQPILALNQLNKHLKLVYALPEFLPTTNTPSFITSTLSQTPTASPPLGLGLTHLNKVINGGSFEYWAWVSSQYRAFGELIELVTTKLGLKPPIGMVIAPPPIANSSDPAAPNAGPTAIPVSSLNPSALVQHAGYYYLLAARASEERWKKFKQAEQAMPNTPFAPTPFAPTVLARPVLGHSRSSISSPFDIWPASLDALNISPADMSSPPHAHALALALATERQVDHASLSIELLTKSYEQFKRQRAGRTTLFIASEIGRLYETSGKLELALRFYERIGRSYRKEGWPTVLSNVLRGQARCAKALNMWDMFVESSIELMSERMSSDPAARASALDDVMALLNVQSLGSTMDSIPRINARLEMDIIETFLNCSIQFKNATGYAASPTEYQIYLATTSSCTPPSPMRLSQLRLVFSDERFNLLITDSMDDNMANAIVAPTSGVPVAWIDIRSPIKLPRPTVLDEQTTFHYTVKADLSIKPGERCVLQGAVLPTDALELRVSRIEGIIKGSAGSVLLRWNVSDRTAGAQIRRRWWVPSARNGKGMWISLEGYGELSCLRVIRKQPAFAIRSLHSPPGYLDEIYPISVEMVNEDSIELQAFCDVEVRGAGPDGLSDPLTLVAIDADALAATVIEQPKSPHQPALPPTSHPQSLASSSHLSKTTPLTPVIMSSKTVGSTNTMIRGLDLGKIAPASTARQSLYIKAHSLAGERVVCVTVFYRPVSTAATDGEDALNPDLYFRKVEVLRVKFEHAFGGSWDVKVVDGKLRQSSDDWIQECEWCELWMVAGNLKCVGPWAIEVAVGQLHQAEPGVHDAIPPDPSVERYPPPKLHIASVSPPSPKPDTWKAGRPHPFLYRMHMSRCAGMPGSPTSIDVGTMEIKWRRQDSGPWTRSVLPIPQLHVAPDGLIVTLQTPADASVGCLFALIYNIYNTACHTYEVLCMLESAEGLVFAGVKSLTCRLLPCGARTLTFNCLALMSGKLAVPKLRIVVKSVGGKERDGGSGGNGARDSAAALGNGDAEIRVLGGESGIFVRPKVHT
ncbi:hypothetical protein SeMB42_g06184 [Synchytrium endobioticum]|uniref:Trafficking protein particle complex subunit 11 domain-containing protein n=1 Tax=Synchytrium endobioticum TaxID=286115 RepID=A0A507CJI7_9FUNG|nr:hypothetical protein SeMB42_g06184 [Synchytrium endobioticum]TPX49685.1 hypothetical protein SeLEV6574_g01314 [Synchytrium endobioticum]